MLLTIIKNGWKHFKIFFKSDLELMRKIGAKGKMTDFTRELVGGVSAVVLVAFVAMEISGEAVQIVFEQCMHNLLKSYTVGLR